MKIHGFVYLVVGTGIAVISKTIGPKMTLFLYLGILFALFGIVRLVLESKKKAPAPAVHSNHYSARHQRVTQPARAAQPHPRVVRQYTAARRVLYCPHCRAQLVPGRSFCPRCGYRAMR